jgi:hypothetical protein
VEEPAVLALHITEEAPAQIQYFLQSPQPAVVVEELVQDKLQLPVVLVEVVDSSIKTAQQEQPLKVMMAQTQRQLALILVEVAVVLEVTVEPSQQTQVQEMVVVE